MRHVQLEFPKFAIGRVVLLALCLSTRTGAQLAQAVQTHAQDSIRAPAERRGDRFEIGLDGVAVRNMTAGVTILALPINTLRFGYFATSRISLEAASAFRLERRKELSDMTVSLETSFLYHLARERSKVVSYVRPAISMLMNRVAIFDGSESVTDWASQLAVGGGVGMKARISDDWRFRFEVLIRKSMAEDAQTSAGLSVGASYLIP